MNAIGSVSASHHILVVDDDPGIRMLIASFLARNGCVTATAADAREMREELARSRFDLIVLDIMMPGEDGLTALKWLQTDGASPPVIVLSAVGSDIDRIVRLEVGAEDYLAKPCNPRELLARIQTVLRHRGSREVATQIGNPGLLSFAGWRMDLTSKMLFDSADKYIHLTDGEFALLRGFVEHPRRVITHDQLLDYGRGEESEFYDRAIDVQVSRLRRKLGATDVIRTVRNEGYMFLIEPRRS